MTKRMTEAELMPLARLGAESRLKQIDVERATLIGAFPDLEPQAEPMVNARKIGKAAKRVHWTQTPEGKRKLSRNVKAAWRKRKASK